MVWQWLCTARSKNMHVTGRLMIQDKASMFSIELGHNAFSASNGWLDAFKRRKNISRTVLSGEYADVNEEVVGQIGRRGYQRSARGTSQKIYIPMMRRGSSAHLSQQNADGEGG